MTESVPIPPRGPLWGVRVVDFTHIVAGPHCTMLLADAGAEVIKIEPPGGDPGRGRGVVRRVEDVGEVSAFFLACNRGKISVEIDLATEQGRNLVWELLDGADVVVENFREGTLGKFGLGAADVLARYPEIVYASIRAFSPTDTVRAERGGLAIVAEGESGLAAHCVDPKDNSPVWYGVPLGDFITGLTAYGAITTSLAGRANGHTGRHLEISMVGSLLAFNAASLAAHEIAGPRGVRVAKDTGPYGFFRTRDGFVTIAITMDKFWPPMCSVIGRPELATDERFATARERNSRKQEVEEIVGVWATPLSSKEVIDALDAVRIPCGVVNDTSSILDTDAFAVGDYLQVVSDGLGGSARLPANPMGFRPSAPTVPLANNGATVIEHLVHERNS